MSSNNIDILKDAIARNAGAVISLPSAELRHFKSRFLSEEADGFWMESIPSERSLIEELVRTGRRAGVSFKSGSVKAIFTTHVRRLEPAYRVDGAAAATTTLAAVLLAKPDDVKEIQRRRDYRVDVPPDSDIAIKVWRIAGRAYLYDLPMPSQQVKCELRDMSLGGLGVTFRGHAGQPPTVSEEDRLRVELTCGGTALLLEGRMRRPTQAANTAPTLLQTGIIFTQLDQDIEGRQALAVLTRFIGQLQRDEVRRLRIGI